MLELPKASGAEGATSQGQTSADLVLRSKGLKDATCVGWFGDDWNCLVGCPPKAMIT